MPWYQSQFETTDSLTLAFPYFSPLYFQEMF